jgi:4-amino-4-deoxy-L-arabinose transferase-like glycosyltransferase
VTVRTLIAPDGKLSVQRAWLALVVVTILMRLPALTHPRPINDEDFYSLIAFEMLDGGKPYVDAVDRKPPLIFWTYAAIFAVGTKYNWYLLHAVAVVWSLLTMAGLFLLVRRLFNERAGLLAALLYGIFLPFAHGSNLAFNGEMLMNLPIVLGMVLTFRPVRQFIRWDLLLAGALFCAAFLYKQPAAIAPLAAVMYLWHPAYRIERRPGWGRLIVPAGMLTIGFFGTLGIVALTLRAQGILDEAYFWTITNHDLTHGPLDPYFWKRGATQTLWTVLALAPLVLFALPSLREAVITKRTGLWQAHRAELVSVIVLLLTAAIGVSSSGRFYSHYYIALIPALVILAAPVGNAVWSARPHRWHWMPTARVFQSWLVLTVLGFGTAHVVSLRPKRVESEAGTYIRERSTPADRMFVWGQSVKLYTDARRRPASRFIATYPLTGYVFGSPYSWDPSYDTSHRIVPGAWEQLSDDFRRHPPLFIVDNDATHGSSKYRMSAYPIMKDLLDSYELVHQSSDGPIYRRQTTPIDPEGQVP